MFNNNNNTLGIPQLKPTKIDKIRPYSAMDSRGFYNQLNFTMNNIINFKKSYITSHLI